MTLPPLLLLDVDGVINALADYEEHLTVWPIWRSGHAQADGTSWPITWAPEVIDQLRNWHEAGRVELQWLTTWGHDANGELRTLLGLPELVVAGTYQEFDRAQPSLSGSRSHADVAPAALDPLSGHWWKYDVLQRCRRDHPGRSIIWVDDELNDRSGRFRIKAEALDDLLAVGPDARLGLAPDDLALVAQRLLTWTGNEGTS